MLDQMTPAQRAAAIAQGKPADRLPCNPNIANGVARIYGCKISAFNSDPKVLAKAQIAAYRRFGYDRPIIRLIWSSPPFRMRARLTLSNLPIPLRTGGCQSNWRP